MQLIERSCVGLPVGPQLPVSVGPLGGSAPTAVSDERERIAAAVCGTAVRAMFAVTLQLAAIDAALADPARVQLGVAIDAVDTALREMRLLIFALPNRCETDGSALLPSHAHADTRSLTGSGGHGPSSAPMSFVPRFAAERTTVEDQHFSPQARRQ